MAPAPSSTAADRPPDAALDHRIARIRAFSRTYTHRIGLLGERLLRSPYTLSEGRVIWELAHRGEATAADLSRDLALDPGYMSRLVRRLVKAGDVARAPDPDDGRSILLSLTGQGRHEFSTIDAASRNELAGMLAGLPDALQERLARDLDAARAILDDGRTPWSMREPQPGDLGWIVEAHGRLYAEEHGFDGRFEGLVAGILADFARRADRDRERCWIAEHLGRPVGSIMAVRHSDEMAQLRCLIVDPAARGLGICRRLVAECVDFARGAGYRRMMLWTVDILPSARRIYEAAGFELVSETPEQLWGRALASQRWEREL